MTSRNTLMVVEEGAVLDLPEGVRWVVTRRAGESVVEAAARATAEIDGDWYGIMVPPPEREMMEAVSPKPYAITDTCDLRPWQLGLLDKALAQIAEADPSYWREGRCSAPQPEGCTTA